MEHIQPFLDYFIANPGWALAVVFLIAFGEALLIIGLFVPSTVALVSAGMLVGTGHLNFWAVFWATAVGAILGDQVSYWAGRLYGQRLKTMWPLNHYPALVTKGEAFVLAHGGKSIAVGRFVPGVKAVVPGIVGMLGMNQPFFVFVNVTSGLVWAAAHVLPGVLLGQGLALAGDLSGHLLVVLLVLLAAIGLCSWLVRLLAASLQPYTHHVLLRLSIWARSRRSRALHRFGKAIHPENPRATALAFLLILTVFSLIVIVDIVTGFKLRNAASNLDLSVAGFMANVRNPPADAFLIPLTLLGSRPVVWTVGLAMAFWLVMWRGWRVAVMMIGVMGVAELCSSLLNSFVGGAPSAVSGVFMSTATLMSGLVLGFLFVLASHAMGRWSKAVVAGLCSALVVAIAFSRIYLGAEWLSGVMSGALLALILSSLFGMAIEAIPARRIRPMGLLAFTTTISLIGGIVFVGAQLPGAETRYAVRPEVIEESLEAWKTKAWINLPQQRIDLAGAAEEAFVLQWAGALPELEQALQQSGWNPEPTWRWQDAFSYLDAKAPIEKLPPRPVLHKGLKAKLTMTQGSADNTAQRLVLRAFRAGMEVQGASRRGAVYLISITANAPVSRFHLYAMPATQPVSGAEQARLLQNLRSLPGSTVVNASGDSKTPLRLMQSGL